MIRRSENGSAGLLKKMALVVLILCEINASGQDGVVGKYAGYNGELLLRSDSTFAYTHGICLCADNAWGTWSMLGDTVRFSYEEVEDVYVTIDSLPNRLLDGRTHMVPVKSYQLVPSWDQKVDTILDPEQGCRLPEGFRPKRLLAKSGRLYFLTKSGRIDRSKAQAIPSAVKVRTHYVKVDSMIFIEDRP